MLSFHAKGKNIEILEDYIQSSGGSCQEVLQQIGLAHTALSTHHKFIAILMPVQHNNLDLQISYTLSITGIQDIDTK